MRPIGVTVAALARDAAAPRLRRRRGGNEFRRLGQELVERMLAHVQKEEMALLPLLEEGMDAETEARLYQEYAESAVRLLHGYCSCGTRPAAPVRSVPADLERVIAIDRTLFGRRAAPLLREALRRRQGAA